MKHYTKLFFAAAVAALGLASCAKEVAPVETPKDNLVTVHFGATAGIEGATKATLTPNEQETLFTSAWENGENGDEIFIQYKKNDETTATPTTGTWNGTKFEATMPSHTGKWEYTACYPNPVNEKISFGANRTQKGNLYNSNYDVMIAPKISCDHADAGKDDNGNDIVFNMERKTGIVYFHLKSKLNEEDVISAKLSVEGGNIASSYALLDPSGFTCDEYLNEITITFEEGTAPKASDFQLWYNVLPTAYTSMSLEVKTANHTLTLNKNKGGNFVAGKLYKIHKDDATWTENKNVTFFYESFDSCDGTGGNDGKWSGPIATSSITADNVNWTFEKGGGANACVKLGASSDFGKATTPALGINTSTATLSFKAGAWDGNKETITIKVTANNGGTVEPSTITLKKGEWTDYTCTISGATETTTLTFAASQKSNNRFFLDEVMVYYGNKPVAQHTQQISFSQTSVECYINDTFTEPVLSGNQTTVTYSSSDEKVATVNAASGKVTILSAGKTEITATAEESEEYKPATAKYTLTVNKQTQNLSFEEGYYSVLLADKDSFVSPVVNGYKTPVSYSITLGKGVAQDAITIDPKTGKITINAVGTATITATAEETEEYEAASANYALTVTTEPTYKKYDGTLTKCPFSAKNKTATINGLTWTLDTDNAGYYAYDNGGIHLGSGKNAISYATFTLDYTSYCGEESVNGVKKITVTCKAGGQNAKVEVFVGSTSVGSKDINNTMTDYAFELKEVAFGNVIVKISQTKTTKAIYIGGVIIN